MLFGRILFTSICSLLVGCSLPSMGVSALGVEEPSLAPKTSTGVLLRDLPRSRKPLAVAVYDFVDYSGQNKPGEAGNYSRAVTQGGLSLLKAALLEAGRHKWFRVVERHGLNNLLQERKIVRAMRAEYVGTGGAPLRSLEPMVYASLMLEGGVVSYESNIMSGGVGARYLGIGGSTQYSRDMVTVYLRAISVATGEVVLSVNASKTIYSQAMSGGLFKFVSYDQIAEAEAGVSYNEPPQLAVRQAIELAVYSMVMEGCREGLWSFADEQLGQNQLASYIRKYDPTGQEKKKPSELEEPTESPSNGVVASKTPVSPTAPQIRLVGVEREAAPTDPSARYVSSTLATTARRPVLSDQKVPKGWHISFRSTKSVDIAVMREQGFSVMRYPQDGSSYVVGPYLSREIASKILSGFSRNLGLDDGTVIWMDG